MGKSGLEARLRASLKPLDGGKHDYDDLLASIGDARFVLLGEATHGTHEFYRERARITRRLIDEAGFDAVAIEGDWPDAWRVHRYVAGEGDDGDAEEALRGFRRFPTWMWRNTDVLDFVGWLRERNDAARGPKVGFYGLDLYGMYASIEAVLQYLDRVDPDAAARARARYACFDAFRHDPNTYGEASLGLREACEREATQQLVELRTRIAERARTRSPDREELFHAEQNARLVQSAEVYYRTMFHAAASSWNVRDRHMADTLAAVVQHLDRDRGRPSKVVLWEHNSHVGDARATELSLRGELTLGQLARERYGHDAFLVGFTTYDGTVTAASEWDEPPTRKTVRPALECSFEAAFHAIGEARFVLLPGEDGHLPRALLGERLERAIGVVYRPHAERASHWLYARLGAQFDAVVHVDHSRAVEPLERTPGWTIGEMPETYPSAL